MHAWWLLLWCLRLVLCEDVVVTTVFGQLRGSRKQIGEKYIDTFKGIPYAEPPTGSLRWARPRRASSWSGVRDATSYSPACPQTVKTQPGVNVTVDEDCLYLNVFTPQINTDKTYPVMVFIHGGSFSYGTGASYDSTMLALRDVVAVTINYRLGVLGFLSTGDSEAPGNFGMLDQVFALQWVKECISSFGGNPQRVTIFGESAGAGSTSLHLLSPLSRGLFSAAICESGVSLVALAVATQNDTLPPRTRAAMLGKAVGCPGLNSSADLIACLRSKTARVVTEAGENIQISPGREKWSPVIDPILSTAVPFLPESPRDMIDKGMSAKVHVIRGINKDEDAFFLGNIPGIDKGIKLDFFKNFIHSFVKQRYWSNNDKIEEAIKEIYILPNVTDPVEIRKSFIQFESDHDFFAPTVLESKLNAKLQVDNPIYLYEFAYRPVHDPLPEWKGVPHGAELPFVFGLMFMKGSWWPANWTETDKQYSYDIITMWTNFAKYGNPTPEPVCGIKWPRFTRETQNYIYMDKPMEVRAKLFPQAMHLWNSVIPSLSKPR